MTSANGDSGVPVTHVQQLIEDTLETNELTYSRHEGAHGGLPGLIVELPGERRLKTNTILSIGEHSVRVEAFVCRKPDENHEGVYRFLLKRNRRLYGVAYTLDNVGDIYLVGRMALASVDAAEIDRVLGQVLEAVDSDFNTLLELGFRSSIQKEWEWRVSRGESLKNLEAFAHLIEDDDEDITVVRRMEAARCGDLVHIDVKKLGKIPAGGGWRMLGRTEGNYNARADKSSGLFNAYHQPVRGYHFLHTAIDGHSRLAYSELLCDERKDTAAAFWTRANAWFTACGITVRKVLTDNGSCYRSFAFRDALGDVEHRRTRPYRPQTNGKVERFHRTLADEWAYARLYTSDAIGRDRPQEGVGENYARLLQFGQLDFGDAIGGRPNHGVDGDRREHLLNQQRQRQISDTSCGDLACHPLAHPGDRGVRDFPAWETLLRRWSYSATAKANGTPVTSSPDGWTST